MKHKLCFVVLLALHAGLACAQAPAAPAVPLKSGIAVADVDSSVRAGEDFFKHVNGNWQKRNPISDNKSSWLPNLAQGELGMQDRSYYLEQGAPMAAARGHYLQFLTTTLALAGDAQAGEHASDVIAFGPCGARHERDRNAAINLERLAAGTALPVGSPAATLGTAPGLRSGSDGEVTPVRYEFGLHDGTGQDEDGAHKCALL